MNKVTVVDSSGVTHVFKGPIRFYHEGMVCRVWNVATNSTLGSFTQPVSVLMEEE